MTKFSLSNQYGRLTHLETALLFENALTHRYVTLGGEEEFVLYLGKENTVALPSSKTSFLGRVETEKGVTLRYEGEGVQIEVVYTATANTFVKTLTVRSAQPTYIKRVALETRNASLPVSRGGEGQPAFIGEELWCGIEYPVANNYYENNELYFTQAPFGEYTWFQSLPVVYGLDACGCLLDTFKGYVEKLMLPKEKTRIYCDWGLHDDIDSKIYLTEKLTLDNVERLSALSKRSGVKFDYYLMDAYWFKDGAPYNEWKEEHFPEGSKNVVAALKKADMKYGLWFDINCINAHLQGMEEYSTLHGNGSLCFACKEIAKLMTDAILKQIRESGIKMIKLDFAYFDCVNADHGHSVDYVEAKEQSVKNFIQMLADLRAAEPELKVLCYNGWTTTLAWIASVEKREGYAVSPYWSAYIDYVYCGDPRPSEIACEQLSDSVSLYTDSMIANFRDSAMPFAAIDDHGTMMGQTCTIYYMEKALLRRGWLLNAMRGSKMNLYGKIDELNAEDERYLAFVDGVYEEMFDKKFTPSMVGGDVRKSQPYGFSLAGVDEGYIVLLNPTARESFVTLSLSQWQGNFVEAKRLICNGELVEEAPYVFGDTDGVRLSGDGYVLLSWKLRTQKIDDSVLFSTGDTLVLSVEGRRGISLTFSKDGKPVRTPEGYPDGFTLSADGKKLPFTVKDKVWSGISWAYHTLSGEKTLVLRYEGKGSIRVKYAFKEVDE